MVIFRYLLKEILSTFTVISLILLLIFVSNQFARYLTMTAAGKIVGMQLAHLIILEVPQLLSLIFPLALYLAILLVYGRLYVDNEMVALSACGFTERQFLKMTFSIASIVFVPVAIFSLWINPIIADQRDHLLAQISATSVLQTLMPGRFQQANRGNDVFYIESMSNDRQSLKNIFVAERSEKTGPDSNGQWRVSAASSGRYFIDPATKDRFVVAENGYRYEGMPGEKNFTIYQFGQYAVRLNTPVAYLRDTEIDSVPSWRLLKEASKSNLDYSAEWQWRLALPLCVFVLAFIAFSLGHVKPRSGRFAKFFPAILIYVIYANFMIMGQDWISRGKLSPYLGLWSLHFIMLSLGAILYAEQQGVFRRLKRKWGK
jgi:lipopolysaccharide export system permease protein